MAKKVDMRCVKDKGHNVLHAAAGKGRLEVCKFPVEEMGLDVNSTTPEGSCNVVFNTAYRSAVTLPL